jgi:hypothetical protein
MSNNTRTTDDGRTVRHIRTIIAADLRDRLAHLAVDLHTTLSDLIIDALILLLRYHGRGDGLAEPVPPATPAGIQARR